MKKIFNILLLGMFLISFACASVGVSQNGESVFNVGENGTFSGYLDYYNMLTKMNEDGRIYISGNSTLENSTMIAIDSETGYSEFVKLENGLWQPTSVEIGSNTLLIGKNVGIGAVGHHIATEASDGHQHLLVHNEFNGTLTIVDSRIVSAYYYVPRAILQPDNSSTWIGTEQTFQIVSPSHLLANDGYLQTYTTAATAPIRYRIYHGEDDTGDLIFDQSYPASEFPASTEVQFIARGYIEFESGDTYFHRITSDASFSLRMDTTDTTPWFASDISYLREDNLLQTAPWENNTSYPAGQYMIYNRTIMVSNDSSVQTGSFASNLDKWFNVATAAIASFWTKVGDVLSYDGNLNVTGNITANDATLSGSLYQPVYGDETGLKLHIPFTEIGTGVKQYDRSPYGNDAIATGDIVVSATSGAYGSAGSFLFSGAIEMYAAPFPISGVGTHFTFEAFIRPTQSQYGGIIHHQANSMDTKLWMWGANVRHQQVWAEGGSHELVSPDLAYNEWYHVTSSFDGATLKLYINGEIVDSFATSNTINWDSNRLIGLLIGSDGVNEFNGQIADVKVYERALADDEVRAHYLRQGGDSVVTSDSFKVLNTSDSIVMEVNSTGLVLNEGSFVGNGSGLTGIANYWNRTGTDLIPTTSGDTVDGRDIAVDGTNQDTHISNSTIHFTEESINITSSQVSDFDTSVDNNANVSANIIHRTSDGSDHTFIDQYVTIGSSPTFSAIRDGANNRVLINAGGIYLLDATGMGRLGILSDRSYMYDENGAAFIRLMNGIIDIHDGTNTRLDISSFGTKLLSPDGTETLNVDNSGVVVSGIINAATFVGDLNGTINTITTATTQSPGDNSTKIATTEYVDTQVITEGLWNRTGTTLSLVNPTDTINLTEIYEMNLGGKINIVTDDFKIINTSGNVSLEVSTEGNIIIGNGSPSAKLSVKGGVEYPQLLMEYDNNNYNYMGTIADGGMGWDFYGTDADLNIFFGGATDGDFMINTNDLFVDTSLSRVGIGTASPSQALEVNGSANITGNLNVGGDLESAGNIKAPTINTTGILNVGTNIQMTTNNGKIYASDDLGYLQFGTSGLLSWFYGGVSRIYSSATLTEISSPDGQSDITADNTGIYLTRGGYEAFEANEDHTRLYSPDNNKMLDVKNTGVEILGDFIVDGSINAINYSVGGSAGFTGSCVNTTYSGGIAISCND